MLFLTLVFDSSCPQAGYNVQAPNLGRRQDYVLAAAQITRQIQRPIARPNKAADLASDCLPQTPHLTIPPFS